MADDVELVELSELEVGEGAQSEALRQVELQALIFRGGVDACDNGVRTENVAIEIAPYYATEIGVLRTIPKINLKSEPVVTVVGIDHVLAIGIRHEHNGRITEVIMALFNIFLIRHARAHAHVSARDS